MAPYIQCIGSEGSSVLSKLPPKLSFGNSPSTPSTSRDTSIMTYSVSIVAISLFALSLVGSAFGQQLQPSASEQELAASRLSYVPRQGDLFDIHVQAMAQLQDIADPSVQDLVSVYQVI